jgi:ABC-2 type transport system ATP-binding protein
MDDIVSVQAANQPIKAIEAANVSRRFGDFRALDGVEIHVSAGEVVGILGPNGAGKSTFLRACEGLERVDGGRILALGSDLAVERGALKGKIGLVLQRPKFSGYATVRETVSLFSSFSPPKIPSERGVEVLGLTAKLDTRIGKLSGGERQRLGVLLGLMSGNEIILLDEPTSELDPQARRVVWRMISTVAREHGSAILMTTHQMEEAELLCDRIYIIDHGRIIASGTPSEVILENCDTMAVVFMVRESALERSTLDLTGSEMSRHGQFSRGSKRVSSVEEGQRLMRALFDSFGPDVVEVGLKRPNLEDVFIELTGAHLRP